MTGLIGWWPLHENTGNTAKDLSGNGNHGNLNGEVIIGVAGKGGITAYSVSDGTDYVDFGDISTPKQITVVQWHKVDSIGRYFWDFGVHGDNQQGLTLEDESGNYGMQWGTGSDGGNFQEDTGIPITTGEWVMTAVTYDSDANLKFYKNGEFKWKKSVGDGSLADSSRPLVINTASWDLGTSSQGHDAQYGMFRVYDRALSPQEVQTLYEWGNGDYVRPLNNSNSSSAVSRWAFDGNADDFWGGNDGSSNVGAGYGNGIRNQAKMFNGSDEYVSVSNTGVTSPVTVSSWIYPKSSGGAGYGRIFDQQDDFDLALGDSNSYAILWEINNNNYWYGSSPLPKNEWLHVAASIDSSGNGKVYLNGSLLDQNNSETVNASNNTARIGDMVSGGRKFDGKIDDVRIYSRALEPYEVFQLYQWGTRGRDMRKLTVNSRGDT